MARIDFYLRTIHRFGAAGAELASGGNVILRFPTGDRYANQTTPHAELLEMIEEVVPAPSRATLRRGGALTFDRELEGRTYNLDIDHQPPGRLKVLVRRAEVGFEGHPIEAIPVERGGAARDGSGSFVAVPPTAPPREMSGTYVAAIGRVGLTKEKSGTYGAVTPAARERSGTYAAVPRGPAPPREGSGSYPAAAHAGSVADPATPSPGGLKEIEKLLLRARGMGASDLHLSTGHPPLARVHGEIKPLEGMLPLSAEALLDRVHEITPERGRRELEERGDTDFAHAIPGASRFRAHLFRDRNGPGAVFRLIPWHIPTVAQIGLPPSVLELCQLTRGLLLVTGATGSGRSTTLATLIDHVNETRSDHIITIEDPIEFVHESKRCLVNQREVRSHTRSFKEALHAALREDPDVVLVGELPDLETVALAAETARAGHLVLGALPAATAPSAVDWIIDQFPADRQEPIRQLLAESLGGVIAQTLCRRPGSGRVAAYEILMGSSAASNLIRERKTFQLYSLMQTGRGQGSVTLNDSLLDLVKRGLVEPREAWLRSVHKAELRGAFGGEDIRWEGRAVPGE